MSMIPRCSFCPRLVAFVHATHYTAVWSRAEEKYVPCCIPCLKRRKDKLIKLHRMDVQTKGGQS